MPNKHSATIWYELLTTDSEAATDFYSKILDWGVDRTVSAPQGYQQFTAAGQPIAGVLTASAGTEKVVPIPCWLGYLRVENVDECVEAVRAAGGAVRIPAQDVPGVGRIATLADPQAAVFCVISPNIDRESHSYRPNAHGHGHAGWNELWSNQPGSALAFYVNQFGWQEGQGVDIGAMGTYQLFLQGGQLMGV